MSAYCTGCGHDVGYVPAEGVTVQCGTCTMAAAMGYRADTMSRLEAVDVADVQAKRKELGWSQEDLALALRIPKSHVSLFERGLRLCPQPIADWLS